MSFHGGSPCNARSLAQSLGRIALLSALPGPRHQDSTRPLMKPGDYTHYDLWGHGKKKFLAFRTLHFGAHYRIRRKFPDLISWVVVGCRENFKQAIAQIQCLRGARALGSFIQ